MIVQVLRLKGRSWLQSKMAAASWAHMWSTVRKCSSGFPFTILRQQGSSSVVLIPTHSSANTEKYGLDFKLSISFLSRQLLMALKASLQKIWMCTEHFVAPLWHVVGEFISICNLQLDQGIECGCKGQAIFGKKIYRLKSLSTMFLFFALLSSASLAAAEHFSCRTLCSFPCSAIRAWITASLWHFDWLCSLSCSVAWFQSWIPRVVHAPLAVEGAFPRFWQSLQNMALLRSIAVHPRIFLFLLLLVAEPGLVEFPLLRFGTHWSTYWCFGIGGSQGITSRPSWDYIFVVPRISTRPSTRSLSGKKVPEVHYNFV